MGRVFDRGHIETSAKYSDYSADEIEATVWDIHDVVRSNLLEHYRKCWEFSGQNYILEDSSDHVFLAFTHFQVKRQLTEADVEIEPGLLVAALNAYTIFYQEQLGRTISFSRQIGHMYKDPVFSPVYVKKSDEWQKGVNHVFQLFKRYLHRYEMSAAEALDYWALDYMQTDSHEWAQYRGVGSEAVRKNARQGREHMLDDGLGATPGVSQFRAAVIDDLDWDSFKNGIYDEENEQYYRPRLVEVLDEDS